MTNTSDATTTYTSGTHASSFSLTAKDGTTGVGYFNGLAIGTSGQLSGTLSYTTYQILKTSTTIASAFDTKDDTLTLTFQDDNGTQTGTYTVANAHGYSALTQAGNFTITV